MKLIFVFCLALLLSFQFALCNLKIWGSFTGWKGNTVVRLSDGTCWKQAERVVETCSEFNPEVNLVRASGQIKMYVRGSGAGAVTVKQINCDDNKTFYRGFSNNNRSTQAPQDLQVNPNRYELADRILRYQESQDRYQAESEPLNQMQSQVPTQTILNVQNNTNKELYYCFVAYNATNGWESHGWYKVVANSNTQFSIGYYTGNIYLYAQYNGGELAWYDPNSKFTFCVDQLNVFHISNSDNRTCYETNYKRVMMSEYSVTPGVFTWTINP